MYISHFPSTANRYIAEASNGILGESDYKYRILLVSDSDRDDESQLLNCIQKEASYWIKSALVREALEIVRESPPDLMVLDVSNSLLKWHEYARKKVQQNSPIMKPQIFAGEEGYKILLARASIDDLRIRYRKEVEYYASSGNISSVSRRLLEVLRDSLEILPEEAAEIEAEVLKPYQNYIEKLHQYKRKLFEKAQSSYHLDEKLIKELDDFQQAWGLRDDDVEPIKEQVKLHIKEQYEEKLRQYEQIFIETTQRNYPHTDEDKNGLLFIRQVWKLRDEDVSRIEARINEEFDQQYQEKIEQYKQMYIEVVKLEQPLSEMTRNRLNGFQRVLGLRNEDVTSIEAELTAQIAEESNTEQSITKSITYDFRGASVGNLAHIVQSNQRNNQIQ